MHSRYSGADMDDVGCADNGNAARSI